MAETEHRTAQEARNLAEAVRETYQALLDTALESQQRNVRMAQSVVQSALEEFKGQADSTRSVVELLTQQTQKQQDTFRSLAQASMEAYLDLISTPFSYYQEAVEAARRASQKAGF
jgi:dsDNA-specific endonuclease/ATPase MutS2